MADPKRESDDLQKEMAKLDAELVTVLDKRAKLARARGALRREHPNLVAPVDRTLATELAARTTGPMPGESMARIFRELHAATAALESDARLVVVGSEGGRAFEIARARYGASAAIATVENTALAIDEVVRHRADFAVLPFETHSGGLVQSTVDAIGRGDLKIAEVVEIAVALHLVNRTGNVADVDKIVATAEDRATASRFLASLGSKMPILDVRSPRLACQIASEDHGAAALASGSVGSEAGLIVAKPNVEDRANERVRYAVVGARSATRTGNDATAFVFSVSDAPGALLDVLKLFAERGINLTKIQSTPVDDDSWNYLFFVEIQGHATDRPVVVAFEDVKRIAKTFKILGSYAAP
ncbi:MAG: prephenate dehydratase domain-containing protein [Polyangiaceae bacterium]